MSIIQHELSLNNTGVILDDRSKSGRQRPWREHKYAAGLVADSYFRLAKNTHFDTARYIQLADPDGEVFDIQKIRTPYDRKAENISTCGDWLNFGSCPNGHTTKLVGASLCRSRLCPVCSWRRSMMVADQIKKVAHRAKQICKGSWIFLTLTVQNVEWDKLHDEITKMMKSFQKLVRYDAFKKGVLGYYRVLEVTRNLDKSSDWYNTFHPHLHVLLYVVPSYFSRNYIKQEEWTAMWKKALKLPKHAQNPIVYVEKVKARKGKMTELVEELEVTSEDLPSDLTGAAVAETAKYSVKVADLVVFKDACYCTTDSDGNKKPKRKRLGEICDKCGCENKRIFEYVVDEEETDFSIFVFDSMLSRRRLRAYGGLLKEAFHELLEENKVQDEEDENADLVSLGDDKRCTCDVCQSTLVETLYRWIPGRNQYIT